MFFRRKQVAEGRKYYENSVRLALAEKNASVAERAMTHWLYEERDRSLMRTWLKTSGAFADEKRAKSMSAAAFRTLLEPALFEAKRARLVETEIKKRFQEIVFNAPEEISS